MAKHEKLYKDSPSIERDKESGEVGIKKPSKADGENMGTEGSPLPNEEGKMPVQVHQHERRDVHHKHVNERLAMHHRHEMEHSVAGEEGGKGLHGKHEAELRDMHKRHEKEVQDMHKRHSGEGEIKKTEETE